jgi:hypothetical protein
MSRKIITYLRFHRKLFITNTTIRGVNLYFITHQIFTPSKASTTIQLSVINSVLERIHGRIHEDRPTSCHRLSEEAFKALLRRLCPTTLCVLTAHTNFTVTCRYNTIQKER